MATITTATTPDAFVFIDTAIGGANQRNHIVKVDEYNPRTGAVDCFATYLHYTAELPAYVATHQNGNGKPSVKGYEGIAHTPAVPFDFDDAAAPSRALKDARLFVTRTAARYDVPLEAFSVWFSGNKGFHVNVPASLFGGFAPANDLPARLKLLATDLAEGLPTFDDVIYQHVRLLRSPNTVHGKTNLHKIPLTVHELMTLTVDEIRDLARFPRGVEITPDDEWTVRPELVILWEQTAARLRERPRQHRSPSTRGERELTDDQTAQVVDLVSSYWTLGQKHELAVCLAGYLAKGGQLGEEQTLAIIERLAAGDGRPSDRENAVRDTYERLADDRPVLGYVGLSKVLSPADMLALQTLIGDTSPGNMTARQSYRVDADEPPPPGRNGADPPPPTESGSSPRYQLTDYGNAERFVDQHGPNVRYCYLWAKWLVWDKRRWRIDDGARAHRLGKRTVRSIYAEAAEAVDDKERAAIGKHALRSEASGKIDALLTMAQSEPGIPTSPDALDQHVWLFNTTTGTIDLRTGTLRAHDHGDLLTQLAPVAYDPKATCPTFLRFLDQIMDGNDELVAFLQRAVGYSLTGDTSERVIFMLYGEGRNGKSTLLEVLRTVLGDYALRTPTETLLAKRDNGIPNDVARLRGTRFVSASEAEEGQRLAEAKIKDLTGGDTISARFMRGEFFDFLPTFKLWLGTNHKPVIRGTDHAIWDRIRLIPFTVRIPPEEQDKHLRDKLIAEAPGILAWAVQGCLAWQRHGLGEPKDVREATADYRAEMDILAGFLADCCVEDPKVSATAKSLYAAYMKWCEENGEKPITQTMMGKRLAERGFAQSRSMRDRYWIGLGLAHDETQGML